MKSFLFLLFIAPLVSGRGGGVFRDGFSSGLGDNTEDSRFGMGLSQEMQTLKKFNWEIGPFDVSGIPDKTLREHVGNLLKNKKVLFKPETKPLKGGKFRAMGLTADGKKIRGKWSGGARSAGTDVTSSQFLELDYDSALRTREGAAIVNFSLVLPPVKGSKDCPMIEFSVPMKMGTLNPEALTVRGKSTVTFYPTDDKEKADGTLLGKSTVGLPMRSGIVDPNWAKGRQFFRQGRSVGQL